MLRLSLVTFLLFGLFGLFASSRLHQSLAEERTRHTPAPSTVTERPPRSPEPVTSYEISARLDTERHEVTGTAKITWTNPSSRPTRQLFFHLYLNAFENERTLFRRSRGGRSGLHSGRPGKIEVRSLTSPEFPGEELWMRSAKHSPDDEDDRTDIAVSLPGPIEGHATTTFYVEFTSTLPEIFERTGYARDFHLVAQWYPKLAKREKSGKWAHFAFHPYAEFYSDFGEYSVTLDVPEDYVVGATGALSPSESSPSGRTVYQVEAPGVIDFAWTAWTDFVEEKRDIAGIEVRLLSPRHVVASRAATWDTLERGLPYLGQLYGAYPYGHLTVVHPPSFARPAGGMEYPQFITTGGSELLQRVGARAMELITIHELAHQWFQSVVASNEVKSPFLDEGLTAFVEWNYLDDTFGSSSLVELGPLQIGRIEAGRYGALLGKNDQPIDLPASSFHSFSRVATIIYGRTPLTLLTWERVHGNVETALSAYARRYRFRHPKPRHFYRVLEEQLGNDSGTELKRIFKKGGSLDLSLGKVSSERTFGGFNHRIEIRRRGSIELPFSVQATFEDGTVRHRHYPSFGTIDTWQLQSDQPLKSIEIDPERRILLDENLLNNRMRFPTTRASNHPRLTAILFSLLSQALSSGLF